MTPYYQDSHVQIFHGDCREILPSIGQVQTLITDPIWPNAPADLIANETPTDLLIGMFGVMPEVNRLAIHLGCDSDPRFLAAVPSSYPFFRVCWLRYIRPHYKGRLLYNSDIAYLFGLPPKPSEGQFLIPGYTEDTSSDGKQAKHPCPRKLWHVTWLVKWWSEVTDTILDPFLGSGTTCYCAKKLGRKCIGIEIEERFCEIAANRCRQMVMEF